MTSIPTASVVVCTRNRAQSLRRCLDAVGDAVSVAPMIAVELIVVDNGSTDETNEILQRWCAGTRVRVRFVYEGRVGLAAARNAGVNAASGEIIVFSDDDCCVSTDYFSVLAKIYASRNGAAIVGGRVELGDSRDLAMTIKTDMHPAVFDGNNFGSFIAGCNMTFNREAWRRLGPLDEHLGTGTNLEASEDTDYVCRAFLADVPVSYTPDLCVYHFHGRRNARDAQKLMRSYSIGNGALYAKYFGTRFAKPLRWNCKNAFLELFGARRLKPELGLSFRAILWANIIGMMRYWRGSLIESRFGSLRK